MRFRILGRLEAWDEGSELELGAGRHRALLAILLLHDGEVVSSDRLVDELWDEPAPPSAAKLVQGYVSRLRRTFPVDSIVTRDAGYLLRAAETDAAEFEELLETASRQRPQEAAETLRRALALWRGSPLAEFEYESWAQPEIVRLEELRLVAQEARIEADLALGGGERLVPELEALVAEHPLRERLRTELMLALYRSGRQADALEVFADARRRLVEELGIEPGPELREMQRRILEHDPELAAARRPRPAGTAPERMRASLRRRRSLLAAALVGVLAAAVAVPLFARGSGGSPGSNASPVSLQIGANGVGAVDPTTGRVVGSVPLPASPSAIAYGDGAVWVTMPGQGAVSRLDPATDTVEQTIGVGASPTAIAVGDGFVWVANSLAGTVSEIDPRTNGGKEVDRIEVGNGPTGLAYGRGAVWVANSVDRTVVRIDPRTGKPGRPIPVAAGADAVAVGEGAVWATSRSAGVLSRIDPDAGRVTATIDVGDTPVALAAGAGAVWVANSRDASVSRVDPATDDAKPIQVGEGPSGVTVAADGTVWVTNELDGTLAQINPRVDKVVRTHAVGAQPQSVALSGGAAYVALRGASAAHRGGTLTLVVPNPSGVYDTGLPRSLDPASGYAAWELLSVTNDGLVGYGRTGGTEATRVVPDLALTLPTVSDGGRTYTFQLRRGIRYSTGQPVRPADIRRGIARALLASGADGPAYYLTGIVGANTCVTAPDRCDLSRGIAVDPGSNVITFHLVAPDPDFLYKLALPIADAVPAGTPLDSRLPLPATGPYEVAGYDLRHHIVRLKRNPRFRLWSAAAQPDGYPDRIVERYELSGESAVRAVERGTADITGDGLDQTWRPELTARLRTRYSSRLHSAVAVGTTAVWLNTRVSPFDDVRVRRALNYAVDRNHLIDLAGGTDVAQVGCQVLPPNTGGYRRYCPYTLHPNADGRYNGPDLAEARRLVAASGTKGQRVVVWFYDIPIGRRNGAYFVTVLRRLGYAAQLRTVPHKGSTWRPDRQAGAGGWGGDYPAPNDFFSPLFTCRSYNPSLPDQNTNVFGFCDKRVDAEIARARALQTTDPPAASRLWSALDHEMTDEALWVAIRTSLAPDFVSSRTGNYTYCYLGTITGSTGACLDQLWVR